MPSGARPRATVRSSSAGRHRRFFTDLFLPQGYPASVAPDYFRFQIWDTVQQVSFFINTVISLQAYYAFHGVGVKGYTGVESATLDMSRTAVGTLLTLCTASPTPVQYYKKRPVFFKFFSGLMEALEHLVEILAGLAFVLQGRAIFATPAVLILYCNPIISALRVPTWDASRNVILQHFTDGHQLGPDYTPLFGDITMKETNQDKGGKLIGLLVGVLMLQTGIGIHLDSPDAIQQAITTGLVVYLLLSLVHIVPLYVSVQQLALKDEDAASTTTDTEATDATKGPTLSIPALGRRASTLEAANWFKQLLLPPGYPASLQPVYSSYRMWQLLQQLLDGPKNILLSIMEWEAVYGVGLVGATPLGAVQIGLYKTCVNALVGLIVGLPAVRSYFNFKDKRWKLWSDLIHLIPGLVLFIAAARFGTRRVVLIGLITLAEIIGAFASAAGARINGSITPAMSKDLQVVKLVDITSKRRFMATLLEPGTAAPNIDP